MSEAVKQLLPAFLALSEAERVQLLELAEEATPAEDVDFTDEQIAEWRRRSEAARSGTEPDHDIDDVLRELREAYP